VTEKNIKKETKTNKRPVPTYKQYKICEHSPQGAS